MFRILLGFVLIGLAAGASGCASVMMVNPPVAGTGIPVYVSLEGSCDKRVLVTDISHDDSPLPGAIVTVKGTTMRFRTDRKGLTPPLCALPANWRRAEFAVTFTDDRGITRSEDHSRKLERGEEILRIGVRTRR